MRKSLLADPLASHAGPGAQGEHDGADHGDQQYQARDLEQVEVLGVEDAADRAGIVDSDDLRRGLVEASQAGRGAGCAELRIGKRAGPVGAAGDWRVASAGTPSRSGR